MRIFITGATGYIGSAVALALRDGGHEVGALVRPDAEQKHLRDRGVVIVSGDLGALPSLGETLAQYDAFIHTAQSRTDTAALDRAAIDAFTVQSGHFVYTSGVWVLGNTTGSDESSPVNPLSLVAWRPPHEELVVGSGGAVLRPGCVYGGKQSLLADWFAAAEQKRVTTIVGDGTQHWALVHLHDLTDLYLRAVEQRATGMLHGIDDTAATLNECATAVAEEIRIEYTPIAAAREQMGPFADALAVDQRISSTKTRVLTGWQPKRTFLSSTDAQWREWREAQSAA